MHHFYDPSIKPIVTTDINDNILYVRTFGLNFYGYPNIIMDKNTDYYEDIFYFLLDHMFSLDFDISRTWCCKGKLFKLELTQEGLATVIFPELEEINIITILNPINEEPHKYVSFGLTQLFNLPEAEIDADTLYGKEILACFIEGVKDGWIIDEDLLIIFEENHYIITFTEDRKGKQLIKISMQSKLRRDNCVMEKYKIHQKRDIRRIK